MNRFIPAILAAAITLPNVAFAVPPKIAMEDREPFAIAAPTDVVTDPSGDVVDRWGEASTITQPWGDLTSAAVKKNETKGTWDFTFTTVEPIPAKPEEKTEIFIFVDRDGVLTNNVTNGFRSGSDAEFALQYNTEKGWYVDFRHWNAETSFWATDKETKSAFVFDDTTTTYSIPFAELPADAPFLWRVGIALAKDKTTAVDAAPTEGVPAKAGFGGSTKPFHIILPHPPTYAWIIIVAIGAALAVLLRGRKR